MVDIILKMVQLVVQVEVEVVDQEHKVELVTLLVHLQVKVIMEEMVF